MNVFKRKKKVIFAIYAAIKNSPTLEKVIFWWLLKDEWKNRKINQQPKRKNMIMLRLMTMEKGLSNYETQQTWEALIATSNTKTINIYLFIKPEDRSITAYIDIKKERSMKIHDIKTKRCAVCRNNHQLPITKVQLPWWKRHSWKKNKFSHIWNINY